MKKLYLSAVLLCFFCVVSQVHALRKDSREIIIPKGFLHGEDYLAMERSEQYQYVYGFINGMTVAPLMGADERYFQWVEQTILKKTITQKEYARVVEEYIRGFPQNRKRSLNIVTYEALQKAYQPDL